MQLNIQVTARAMDYIKNKLAGDEISKFRLTIKKSGCSGYAYAPAIVSEVKTTDFILALDQLNIYVDPAWAHVMQGLEIDYVEDAKGGLKQKRLVFANPNESARCGCGESFHI